MDSDQEILAKIEAGRAVLREIVRDIARRYKEDLQIFCGRILVTYQKERLEDVIQEIFEAVYRNIQQYDISRGPKGIKPWLYGIARNKCIDELREIENEEPEQETCNLGGEREERPFQIILAKRAFVELTAEERLMIATDLMDWFSRKELASMFSYDNPESYDRRMYRIRQKMKKIIEG